MLGKLFRSVKSGLVGLAHVVRSEANMRIHAAAAVGVVVAGFVFELAVWEWVAILLCIGLVMSVECVNTALERLVDRVSLDYHPLLKQAKDSAAGAVLLLALMSAVIGGIIFFPRLRALTGW